MESLPDRSWSGSGLDENLERLDQGFAPLNDDVRLADLLAGLSLISDLGGRSIVTIDDRDFHRLLHPPLNQPP